MKATKKEKKNESTEQKSMSSNNSLETVSQNDNVTSGNDQVQDSLALDVKKEKKEKKPKEKLSKFEKRKIKHKKQEDLLNMRGIPKYYMTYLLEVLYIFLVEVLVKYLFGNLMLDWTLLRIFLSSNVLALIITLVTNNMPLKLRRGLLIMFNFFVAFYAWLQLGFINFIGTFMSIGNVEQGTKITEYIFEFLSAYEPILHIIYVPFILTIVYFVFERYVTRDGFEKKVSFSSLIQDMAILVYAAILIFMYYVTMEVDFMQNKFQTVSNKELFEYPSNPAMAIKNFGTTVYFGLDIKSTFFDRGNHNITPSTTPNTDNDGDITDMTREIDDTVWESLIKIEEDPSYKTLNNYFINRDIVDMNDKTGIFEGKNLVMVMLESVGSAVFSEEYKEYFPTLYKLYSEGITGINNYSPRNNCATGDSEMTSQISIYSIGTTCTVNSYKDNEYKQALMYMLRKNGYYTSAYHDYTDMYYSRSVYEYKMGSMMYYGVTDLGMSYEAPYKEWPSDLEFFQKATSKFIDMNKFAAYIVSVTAHTPYIFSSKMGNKHLDLFKDLDVPIQTKRYLSKVKEDDLALEYLLNTLEEKGILDDTVIVLFGDHYPYGLSESQYQSIAKYDIDVNHEVDRTPFIIYNSETAHEEITKYTTPLDYAPTLLNMFGIEYDPRYYFGHDVFSDYTDYAVFPDNSWQNSNGYYSASLGEFKPSEGVEPISDAEIIYINKEITDMRNMSSLAIKKNYFSYLFKYFDEYAKLEQEKKDKEKEELAKDEASEKKDTEED